LKSKLWSADTVEDSKFNRGYAGRSPGWQLIQVYVYADALEKGFTPFDRILDAPFSTMSGGNLYSRVTTTKIRRQHYVARALVVHATSRREAG